MTKGARYMRLKAYAESPQEQGRRVDVDQVVPPRQQPPVYRRGHKGQVVFHPGAEGAGTGRDEKEGPHDGDAVGLLPLVGLPAVPLVETPSG